jgi:hypothetical protein
MSLQIDSPSGRHVGDGRVHDVNQSRLPGHLIMTTALRDIACLALRAAIDNFVKPNYRIKLPHCVCQARYGQPPIEHLLKVSQTTWPIARLHKDKASNQSCLPCDISRERLAQHPFDPEPTTLPQPSGPLTRTQSRGRRSTHGGRRAHSPDATTTLPPTRTRHSTHRRRRPNRHRKQPRPRHHRRIGEPAAGTRSRRAERTRSSASRRATRRRLNHRTGRARRRAKGERAEAEIRRRRDHRPSRLCDDSLKWSFQDRLAERRTVLSIMPSTYEQ